MGEERDIIQRRELREFLRAKRAELTPETVGIRAVGRRRAIGLRREELASLAGVGLTWYTWLEQGRDIRVSEDMLSRVANALQLSPSDTVYLYSLAGRHGTNIRTVETADANLQLALDGFTAGPAWILNSRVDVLAFNKLADSVYSLGDEGPFARNMVWRLFMDPDRRTLYVDWLEFATFGIGLLRGNYASKIGDPQFEALIKALQESSSDFDRLWIESRRKGTSSLAPATVRLRIPRLGIVSFVSVRLGIPNTPGHVMVMASPADRHGRRLMAKLRTRLRLK